jgi:dinuclear metal center YbgI/SA1388 family protein
MTTVKDLTRALEMIAPLSLAESWDNVGLLFGDETREVKRVRLCIDYTQSVAKECRRDGVDFVVAYHPAIFSGLKRLPGQSLIFQAIRDGLALYSPHTALDVAEGGTNDVLADALGMKDRAPLREKTSDDSQKKLVTFVPEDAVQKVSDALFAAGAGQIGNYSGCSFLTNGTGTFCGEEGSDPRVGKKGVAERIAEVRLETVVSDRALSRVVAALHAAHPYETPAFDLVRVAAAPTGSGQGRIGTVEGTLSDFCAKLKVSHGVSHVLVSGDLQSKIKRAAVLAGAGAEHLDDAIKQKADLFVTGELKHHDVLRAASRGVSIIMMRHSASERAALAPFATRLRTHFPDLSIDLSTADRDPLEFA